MSFSRIILDPKNKFPIITEDLALVDLKQPLFILADRFKVFRLRIINDDFYDERLIGFVIDGKKEKHEQLIVILTKDLQNELILRSRFQKKLRMDREMASLLAMALLVRLRDKDGYCFISSVLPNRKENFL